MIWQGLPDGDWEMALSISLSTDLGLQGLWTSISLICCFFFWCRCTDIWARSFWSKNFCRFSRWLYTPVRKFSNFLSWILVFVRFFSWMWHIKALGSLNSMYFQLDSVSITLKQVSLWNFCLLPGSKVRGFRNEGASYIFTHRHISDSYLKIQVQRTLLNCHNSPLFCSIVL